MRLLLDTHVVVWLAQEPDRVPRSVQEVVRAADARLVSAVSAYEIAYKARSGRLPRGDALVDGWGRLLMDLIATEAPVTGADMIRAGQMSWDHRDPFDRMLVAQAQADGLVLVTVDQRIRDFGDVRTIWA